LKYSSSFTHDLNFGEKAEDWINEIFNDGKLVEVKSDRLAHKTGNVYIEYECRNKPSGIATTTAHYWIYRIQQNNIAIIIPTERLKEICRVYYKEGRIMLGGDNNLSKGFLIPLIDLIR
jgi:hypothetical protein